MNIRRTRGSTAWLMLGGFALSRTVDSLIAVAGTVAVIDRTGSTGWVAAVAAARMIPMAVLGVLVVAAVQVSDQRFVLGFSAALRVVAAFGLALIVSSADSDPTLMVIAIGLAGLASAPYRAGAGRLIATQTVENRLATASTAFNRVDYGSVLVAPGLCGGLLFATSISTTFVITAGLSALLALSLVLVPADRWPRPSTAKALRQVGAATRLVLAVREARNYLAIRAAARVALGIVGVVIAFFPARAGAQNAHVAFLQAALGVGAMAIALAPGRVPDRGGLRAVLGSVVLLAGALVSLGLFTPLATVAIALAVVGAADLVVHLTSAGSLRRTLPSTAAAVSSGVADSLVAIGVLVGTLICPPLIDAVGIDGACYAAAGVVLVAALALLPGLVRADTLTERHRQSAAPVLHLLERCPALDGLSQLSLEMMAESGRPVVVRRGALAVSEGARADAVYVVRSGELVVHVSGEDAARTGRMVTLGPGDLFGEIGVLLGRPRTASVLALEAAELVAIPADVFSAALTAGFGTAVAIEVGMSERLSRSHG